MPYPKRAFPPSSPRHGAPPATDATVYELLRCAAAIDAIDGRLSPGRLGITRFARLKREDGPQMETVASLSPPLIEALRLLALALADSGTATAIETGAIATPSVTASPTVEDLREELAIAGHSIAGQVCKIALAPNDADPARLRAMRDQVRALWLQIDRDMDDLLAAHDRHAANTMETAHA